MPISETYDELMKGDAREFRAGALCSIAKCSPVTLRAWRRRNGLFPKTKAVEGWKWNLFSLADIQAVKLVVNLTSYGVTAQVAVDAAMKLLSLIEQDEIRGKRPPRGADQAEIDRWLEDKFIVLRLDKKGKINFVDVEAKANLVSVFTELGGPASLLIINVDNLMNIDGELEKVSRDQIDYRLHDEFEIARRKNRSKPAARKSKKKSAR